MALHPKFIPPTKTAEFVNSSDKQGLKSFLTVEKQNLDTVRISKDRQHCCQPATLLLLRIII